MMTGEQLRTRRIAMGLTQRALGMRCGFDDPKTAEQMVQHWEHGRRPVPRDRIKVVAAALELKVEDLL